MPTVRDSTYYKKWYLSNREKLNKRRREQYHLDPKVRAKALDYQAAYRERVGRASTRGQPHYRNINGQTLQVFRIGPAASMIGCSIEFIRKYEALSVIPHPILEGSQRYYVQSQIDLMKDFFDAINMLKYSKDTELKTQTMLVHQERMAKSWAP